MLTRGPGVGVHTLAHRATQVGGHRYRQTAKRRFLRRVRACIDAKHDMDHRNGTFSRAVRPGLLQPGEPGYWCTGSNRRDCEYRCLPGMLDAKEAILLIGDSHDRNGAGWGLLSKMVGFVIKNVL